MRRPLMQRMGLGDANGDVSFNKVVTLASLALFGVMVVRRLDPSPWVLTFGITVIGAGFGLKGFMAARAGVTLSGTTATQTTVTLDANRALEAIINRDSPHSPHGSE